MTRRAKRANIVRGPFKSWRRSRSRRATRTRRCSLSRTACDGFRDLTRDYPSAPKFRRRLAETLRQCGELQQKLGDERSAQSSYGEAMHELVTILQERADDSLAFQPRRNDLAETIGSRDRSQSRSGTRGTHRESARDRTLAKTASAAAATAMAVCARTSRETKERDAFQKRALEMLTFAVERGFAQAETLWEEDWRALHGVPEMVRLVDRIENTTGVRHRHHRDLIDPIPSRWICDQSPEQLSSMIANGWRVVDIEIETAKPLRLAATLVKNEGHFEKQSWFVTGSAEDVQGQLGQYPSHLNDLEVHWDGRHTSSQPLGWERTTHPFPAGTGGLGSSLQPRSKRRLAALRCV